ncbi:MAG: O-antigen ligase [Dokdonia sp.]|jgi:O-antigen ligase
METIKSLKGISIVKIAIGLLFALVVLPSNLKAIAILLFGIAALINALQRPWYFDKRFFITNAILFLVISLTYFYSDNTAYGERKLTQMASLIVFPFVFAMLTKEDSKEIFKNLTTYLCIYVIGVFLFNVIPFLWFFATDYSFPEMMEHFGTVLRVKMGKFNIHPIYLSMHCSIAILFSFYILRELRSKIKIAAILGIDITLVLFLLLYAKKGPLIALMIVFSLFVVFQRKQKLLKPYLLAITTLIFLTIAIPKTRDRFVELLKIENLDKGEITSTNIRYTIYDTAQKLIVDSPLVGYGIGDYNDVLQKKYTQDENLLLAERKYNAHNQYFSLLLIGGIVVLLAFLFMTGINLVYAIRYNNQLLILLLVFYVIMMFTENILERESGIIFFAFFLNFFGLKSLYTRE